VRHLRSFCKLEEVWILIIGLGAHSEWPTTYYFINRVVSSLSITFGVCITVLL
jgi:hypothetical protein